MITLRAFTDHQVPLLREALDPHMDPAEVKALIAEWNTGKHNGRDFAMLGVWQGETLVGMISLYRHTSEAVSIGPEIFSPYRRRGYAKEAMTLAMELAHQKGYKIVSQQIRTDNTASIALHTALGFETSGAVYTNAKGNQVSIYLKSLI